MLSSLLVLRTLGTLRRLAAFHLAGAISLFAITLFVTWPAPAAGAPVGPAVKDVIEFTRIIQPLNHDNDALQSQISPNGKQAFIVTRKADVGADRNRFEILLLDVRPERLAARPTPEPRSLFAVEAERDPDDSNPALREARWVGNQTIVFRARLHDRPFQAYRLDVASRRLTQLTFEPLGLVHFDVSQDVRRVVYVAPVSNPAVPPGARSVVVGTHSFWSVNFGGAGVDTQQRRYRFLVAEAGVSGTARPLGASFPESSGSFPRASISPDGRWSVLARYEPERQLAWGQQYPQVAEATATYGPSRQLDPLGYYSRPMSYVPRRLVAYRLADGKEQAIVDAPDDSLQSNQSRTDRLWQRGGTSVVIAGTYLPRAWRDANGRDANGRDASGPDTSGPDASGPESGRPEESGRDAIGREASGRVAGPETASHIIEYWPDSGRWREIATLRNRLKTAVRVAGDRDAFIAVDGTERRRFERGSNGHWRESGLQGEAPNAAPRGTWQLHVDESLNLPPDVFATGPSGSSVRLTRLNPQYSPQSWGAMAPYGWKDAKGRPWNGGLMLPANFDAHTKHALVIQSYGFSPTRFYLDGSNVFDGYTSGFAGRAFLRENILVLALPWGATAGGPEDFHGQISAFSEGVRGAIDSLVAEGWVDREKVGIMGWSATGERVLNLVTFADAPIRAASLLDGDANTLFSMTITYAVMDGIQIRKERANEGGPYGDSLERWVRNDPSLHTDCIRAALRIETYGPETHNNWDVYALLRRQYKPVEMIVFPQGAHALGKPSERMISLQGNVDWYRFWLNHEQRTEPVLPGETPATLGEQYVRWGQLEELKRAADAKPDCVRTAGGE